MANRILRDTTDSEKIEMLSWPAEVFFYRVMMKADDYGVFHAKPSLLKASLFPLRLDKVREADIIRWLAECEKAEVIALYEADSKPYLVILNFGQRMRNMKKRFPSPPDELPRVAASCRELPPEREREIEDETEIEKETERETSAPAISKNVFEKRNFEWFKKQIDEIWTDQLPSEKKKNLEAAIENAWGFISADEQRLANIDAAGCKQLVSKSFNFIKPDSKNQKPKHDLE